MHEGMLPVPGVVRRLVPALAAVAVAAVPLLPGTALAQAPSGSAVTGEVVQAWPEAAHDAAEGSAAEQPLTWIETTDGESVRIPTEDAAGLPVGSTVQATVGATVVDEAAALGLDRAHELLDATVVEEAEPVRAATNEVTVAVVAPGGVDHDDVGPEQVAAVVDGPVAEFWAQQTGGAVDLTVARTHPTWVDTRLGCGDPGALWDEVAAAVDFEPGPGRHLLIYLSSAAPENCGYGLAEVGSQIASGGRAYVRDLMPSLVAHELGHNFGLGHSSALHCDGVESGGCHTASYHDLYDVMGASWEQMGTLNAVQADTLGLFGPSGQRTLRVDGSVTEVALAPLSSAAGVRAVRLQGSGGRQYWIELRTAAGQDEWIGTGADRFGLEAGVLVRRTGDWPDTSLLLDPTPLGPDDVRTALPVGETVRLAGGFAVTVAGADADGATLSIDSRAPAADGEAPAEPTESAGAPDVLPSEGQETGGTGGGAVDPAAPVAADEPQPEAQHEAQPEPQPQQEPDVVQAGEPAEAEEPARAVAGPAVVPASDERSLALPAAAGGVLCGATVLVARQLLRTRARR